MPNDKIETAASSTSPRRNRKVNVKRKSEEWDPKDYCGNQKSYLTTGPSENQVVRSLIDYSIKIPPIYFQKNLIVAVSSFTPATTNRKNMGKRKSGRWDPKDCWGNHKPYPPPGPSKNQVVHSILDYSIKIPTIPPQRNPWNPSLYEQLPVQPVFTKEQQQHNLMTYFRANLVFENHQVVFPKWPTSKIELVGLSKSGTVFIKLLDEKSLKLYKNFKEYINIWFIVHHEMDKLSTKIQKEDVQIGLIVFAKISKPGNRYNNSFYNHNHIRAKIVKFNSKQVYVSGVDEVVSEWIGYDNLFYYTSMLNYCPFQIMECSLKGLENWENTFQMRVVMLRMLDIVLLGRSSSFWLKEFKKKDRKKIVVIRFPDNVPVDYTSLNACILDQLKNFDFEKDCQVTP